MSAWMKGKRVQKKKSLHHKTSLGSFGRKQQVKSVSYSFVFPVIFCCVDGPSVFFFYCHFPRRNRKVCILYLYSIFYDIQHCGFFFKTFFHIRSPGRIDSRQNWYDGGLSAFFSSWATAVKRHLAHQADVVVFTASLLIQQHVPGRRSCKHAVGLLESKADIN